MFSALFSTQAKQNGETRAPCKFSHTSRATNVCSAEFWALLLFLSLTRAENFVVVEIGCVHSVAVGLSASALFQQPSTHGVMLTSVFAFETIVFDWSVILVSESEEDIEGVLAFERRIVRSTFHRFEANDDGCPTAECNLQVLIFN